jgi:hypothetical protein
MILIKCILIISLLAILIQDYKERMVYWFLFPLFLIAAGFLFASNTIIEIYAFSVASNLILCSIMLMILYVYFKLRYKSAFFEVMGLGDVLFLVALSFSFAPMSFLILLVSGLLFCLLIHQTLSRAQTHETIPLAGYLSAFFCLVYVAHWTGIINHIYAL